VAVALLPALVRADTSTRGPTVDKTAENVLGRMLEVMASASEPDPASAVKVKNFQGSGTLVRSALAFGILRSTGKNVAQAWATTPEMIGSALAFFDATNQKNLEDGFHTLFGRALVKKRSGSGDNTRYVYDPAALEAAFTKLYVAPTGTVGGVPAKVVYDKLLKDWMARKADTIADVLGRKGFLTAAARDFDAKSAAARFDGLTWQTTLADKLPESLRADHRLVGTLARRQADGSLPTLLRLLRKVLADYDPKTLERVGAKLSP
jgi:hypothetical protein